MKTKRWSLLSAPFLTLTLAGSMPSATAEAAEGRMTRGKLAADLGDPRAAERLFADVAADAAVPANARAEALVRLGVVQRAPCGRSLQVDAAGGTAAMKTPSRLAERDTAVTLTFGAGPILLPIERRRT
jgi:hypothetical protein